MMRIIQDLRIGTKLAITSTLAILMVAAMLYMQVTGGANVHEANATCCAAAGYRVERRRSQGIGSRHAARQP